MTAYTCNRQAPAPIVTILLLAVIITLAVGVACHAVQRHGTEAMLARTCAERPEYMFFNPLTGRTALVCMVDGKWGVWIADHLGNEITSFVKNKMRTFNQVRQYLENVGYGLIP